MNSQEIIKRIQDSDYYGLFVEIGAGVPVTSMIYNLPGASKVIHASFSPYSKEAQEELLGKSDYRSVSYENILKGLTELIILNEEFVNFIYCSSFQLGSTNDTHSTHGWVGVTMKINNHWIITIGHMSKHIKNTREESIKEIGVSGLQFLSSCLFGESLKEGTNIDILKYYEYVDYKIVEQNIITPEFLKKVVLKGIGPNDYICIQEGQLVRLEDVFRDQPIIALYKGSFAPPTNAHLHFVEEYENMQQNVSAAFMISINTFQKGEQNIDSLLWRIKMINKLGYPVIINNNGFYYDNAEFFRNKFPGKEINFLVGSDTINRVIECEDLYPEWSFETDDKFKLVHFYVAMRPNVPLLPKADDARITVLTDLEDVSSTEVRNCISNGDIDGVKKRVPKIIVEDYIRMFKIN